ncbi:hypothetical protein SDC9_41937 [bioreactor metagenome]|uniref:Uncharacterized protein n=1 Tax=bioreactor metagenome TaxID=1076179 RepID=A0A644VWC8_9ZZZZ
MLVRESFDHLLGLGNAEAQGESAHNADRRNDDGADLIACPHTVGEEERGDDEPAGNAEHSDARSDGSRCRPLPIGSELVRVQALVVDFPQRIQAVVETDGENHPQEDGKRLFFCIPCCGNRENHDESEAAKHQPTHYPDKTPAEFLGQWRCLVGDIPDDGVVDGIPDRINHRSQGGVGTCQADFGLVEHEYNGSKRPGEKLGDELAHPIGDHDAFLNHMRNPSSSSPYTAEKGVCQSIWKVIVCRL